MSTVHYTAHYCPLEVTVCIGARARHCRVLGPLPGYAGCEHCQVPAPALLAADAGATPATGTGTAAGAAPATGTAVAETLSAGVG